MKKMLALTLTVSMCLGVLLTGCGSNPGTPGQPGGNSRRVVNVCSWGEYIDPDLITQFEDETGIQVNYQVAESNETTLPSV